MSGPLKTVYESTQCEPGDWYSRIESDYMRPFTKQLPIKFLG